MIPDKNLRLMWLDIETTGLDPTKDKILEIASVPTAGKNRTAPETHFAIACDTPIGQWNREALDMHKKNGLASLVHTRGIPLKLVEKSMIKYVKKTSLITGQKRPILAGLNIHFDRSFLKVHMPRLEAMFHYRMFDLTTIRLLYGAYEYPDRLTPKHRALSDVVDEVDEFSWYFWRVQPWWKRLFPWLI